MQPFLQGSLLVCQTDRPSDHATRSVTVGLIYITYVVLRYGVIIIFFLKHEINTNTKIRVKGAYDVIKTTESDVGKLQIAEMKL